MMRWSQCKAALFHWGCLAVFGLAVFQVKAEPWTLKSRHLRLDFDNSNGAWIGLKSMKDGWQWIANTNIQESIAPAQPVKIDTASLDTFVKNGRALSLLGDWLYTPEPQNEKLDDALADGHFEKVKWEKTPVPGRHGIGDNRLSGRTGAFWYRCDFVVPTNWTASDMALVIGAVDDFDSTYINDHFIGSTGSETPHHWEAPRYYRFPATILRPGQTNTLAIKVTNGAYDGGIAGPVVLCPEKLACISNELPKATCFTFEKGHSTNLLYILVQSGNLEYSMEYSLPKKGMHFSRQLTIKNVGEKEQLVQTCVYTTPVFSAGKGQNVLFPGSLPWGDNPEFTIKMGGSLAPRGQDPLVVLWNSQRNTGLGSWFHCEEEYAPVSVIRQNGGLEVRHSQGIVMRLNPGASVILGREYFWITHGPRDEAIRGVQEVYKQIGLHAPEHGLPGLKGMVMYCGHPGGVPEQGFRGYGGFNALRAYTPTLRRMGVDLVWLLPIWEHGDGTRWNLYGPLDPFQVSPLYGTTNELKTLSNEFKKNGIELVFDLVPHGPPEESALGKAHPEWVARNQDGSMHHEWGQLAFDNAHPGWQETMGRAAEWGAREFGAVGARVDCAAGGPMNWNRDVTDRPSLSSLAGGLGMNKAIRDGYLRVHPNAFLLPEEYTGANIFYRVADLTYDAQLYFLFMDLKDRNASPGEWARAISQFLEDQQQSLPPGGLKMRWLSNHDTVSWTFQKRRPQAIYGVQQMHALMALCALIEGVPMTYQGDEDPSIYKGKGESSVGFLSQINGLRKSLPALREGSADYGTLRVGDGVFSCVRKSSHQTAVVLINLNPNALRCRIPAWEGSWTDRLSGESFSFEKVEIPMAPYQTRVLTK